jgi:hypothetical protein
MHVEDQTRKNFLVSMQQDIVRPRAVVVVNNYEHQLHSRGLHHTLKKTATAEYTTKNHQSEFVLQSKPWLPWHPTLLEEGISHR